jgi:hypothetical protein
VKIEVTGRGQTVSTFSLEPGEGEAKLHLEVPTAGGIRGSVRLQDGVQLEQRSFVFVAMELPLLGKEAETERRRITTAPVSRDGGFEISDLAPARYHVEVQQVGLLGEAVVDVTSGRTLDVVLDVQRGGILRTHGVSKLPAGCLVLFVSAPDGVWRRAQSVTRRKGDPYEVCATLPPGVARWRLAWRAEGQGEPTIQDSCLAEGGAEMTPGSEHLLEIP